MGKMDMAMPFRMRKINLVWEKAQKSLSKLHLSNLFADLSIQDKLELQAKKRTGDGIDDDGEYQAEVRRKLIDILVKYGLQDTGNYPEINKAENEAYKDMSMEAIKMDKKLAKLWKKAQLSGFSDEELEDLKREFLHHRQKVDEYKALKNEIDAMDGTGRSHNSLEQLKEEDGLHPKENKRKQNELKAKHRQIKENYEYLHSKADRTGIDDNDIIFRDPKVIELWVLAQRANFSEVELESFKEELKHFEHKLKKHEHFKREVDLSAEGKKDKHSDSHIKLEKNLKDYSYKVKKIHTELKMRVGKAMGEHSEL